MLDPCARMATPPGEIMLEMFENLGEIVWNGAAGKLVEPKMKAKWGAQITLYSSFAEKNWQPVSFPKEMRDRVKLRNLYVSDSGKHYVVPHTYGLPDIGAVVGLGDTPDEAMKNCREVAKQVEGYGIETQDELDAAMREFEKADGLKKGKTARVTSPLLRLGEQKGFADALSR
jgi:hypothetical protein